MTRWFDSDDSTKLLYKWPDKSFPFNILFGWVSPKREWERKRETSGPPTSWIRIAFTIGAVDDEWATDLTMYLGVSVEDKLIMLGLCSGATVFPRQVTERNVSGRRRKALLIQVRLFWEIGRPLFSRNVYQIRTWQVRIWLWPAHIVRSNFDALSASLVFLSTLTKCVIRLKRNGYSCYFDLYVSLLA